MDISSFDTAFNGAIKLRQQQLTVEDFALIERVRAQLKNDTSRKPRKQLEREASEILWKLTPEQLIHALALAEYV